MSTDSFVPTGGNTLHYPRINCLKSWVRLWLFEGKRGANEQLINCPPCILTHNPLAFWLAFHEEQIYKRLLEILQLLKLNLAALLLRHIRAFSLLVVHCFPQPERTASVHCLELPWKCRCHGTALQYLTQCIPSSSTPCSWPLCVLWYSFFTCLDWISSSQ